MNNLLPLAVVAMVAWAGALSSFFFQLTVGVGTPLIDGTQCDVSTQHGQVVACHVSIKQQLGLL